jgi:hypothetical protein
MDERRQCVNRNGHAGKAVDPRFACCRTAQVDDVKDETEGAKTEAGGASLREQVYDELRFRLITGKIAPGLGISSRGLAQQLGVSQMPVRDALGRLAAEGAAG